MPTLGEELKRRREERGIALNDISEATRIGTRFLKAIEMDNFSILPGGIFTRSFIRAYAKEVGMEEDEAIGLYQEQTTGQAAAPVQQTQIETQTLKPRPVEIPQPIEKPQRRSEPLTYRQTSSPMNWSSLVIAGGILVFIVIVVIALVKTFNKGGDETPTQTSTPAQNTQPSAGDANKNVAPDSQQAVIPQGQPLMVQIGAVQADCWVRYKIDGEKPVDTILKPGQTKELPPAQQGVSLKIGNKKTFSFKINSRDATLPADAKEYGAEITISRDNIQSYMQ